MWSAVALALIFSVAGAQEGTNAIYPARFNTTAGFEPYLNSTSPQCVTLMPSDAVLTLDYGTETTGFPFFSVQDISSAVQIESKYTEAQAGLDERFGDGPWTFANGLSNTFRVETFNVTETGDHQSFFQQGGFRWQSLTLLGDTGNVTLCGAGLKSYNNHSIDNLPGSFNSSNTVWNEIWALGARTVQQSCIANGSAPSTWEVVSTGSDAGVLLRGQQPAQSVHGLDLADYTMSFSTKIVRGGTGWKVASDAHGYGPYFVLTSEYPADSTFLNTNRTLVPPNTLVVGYGYNLVNQTTLTTGPVVQYPVSFDVKEGLWYEISTAINQTGYTITIVDENNSTVPPVFVPLADFGSFTTGTPTQGTWSFGPYQDQTALVRDVQVYAQNGTIIYTNPMNNASVLEEFGVMNNTHNVCLDGSKRDRLVWSGDFVHANRIILASTNEQEFITGTLAYLLEWQATSGPSSGLVTLAPGMGRSSDYAVSFYNSFGLLDYQMLFLVAYSGYYLHSGDMAFLQSSWAQASKVVEALLTVIDPGSGLAVTSTIPGSLFFIGASDGTAPSALLKFSLDQMAILATAVGDNQTASSWTSTAENISEAVNRQLWSDSLGTYAESLASPTVSSISGTAWAIIAGIANQTQTLSAITALSGLRLGVGYKTDSAVDSSNPSVNLSPFLSGFLLESLFISLRDNSAGGSSSTYDNATTEAISVLLDQLWSAEVTQDEYYSGASWEYIFPDGSPGLGLFTSLSHPWGGAPTYVLTEYLLGIQPVSAGYSEWRFSPSVLLNSTSWVSGRVQTPHGYIQGNWTLAGQDLNMNICSPEETSGSVQLPFSVQKCVLDGQQTEVSQGQAFQVDVSGGLCHSIDVVLG